jgi:signal transduction histidine kinase/CheY-like chemotaxis protein
MPLYTNCTDHDDLLAGALDEAGILFWSAEVTGSAGNLTWRIQVAPASQASPLLPLTRYREQPGFFWIPGPDYPDYQAGANISATAIHDGQPGYRNTFRVIKGQRLYWLEEVVRIRKVASGAWNLVGILRDVTSHREAELAERRATGDLHHLLDRADCVLWQATVVADNSPTWTWNFCLHPSTLQRRLFPHALNGPVRRLSIGYDRPELSESLVRAHHAMRSGAPGYEQEFRLIHCADRHVVWIHEYVTITPIGPDQWDLVGVMLDITERKLAESSRDEEKLLAAATLDAMDEAVLTFDPACLCSYANPAASRLLRRPTDQLLGQPGPRLVSLVSGTPPAPVTLCHESVALNSTPLPLPADTQIAFTDAPSRYVAGCLAPLRIGEKNFGSVLVLRDITPHRKLQQHIQQLATTESLGTLAAGVAHDFNNLLAAIVSQIALAELQLPESSPARAPLAKTQTSINRAHTVASQLLTFARGGEPIRESLTLPHLLHEAVSVATQGSRTTCSLSLPGELWPVLADQAQIFQVFYNLILNSVQAMPDGGTITVTARNEESPPTSTGLDQPAVQITVRDSGPGIPPHQRDRVFTPFFTTKKEGFGLGLATVASIVRRHGGHIELQPDHSPGTCFEIWLPALPSTASPVPPATPPAPARRRVLVMDDEEMIRESLADCLRIFDFDVITAPDGETAFMLYHEALTSGYPPDVLILDLTIRGGMGGVDTLAAIGRLNPSVRAIAISGYSHDPVMANPRHFGFSASIPKPWKLAELRRLLEAAISDTASTP